MSLEREKPRVEISPSVKSTYAPPRLVEYGPLKTLTASGSLGQMENSAMVGSAFNRA